MVTALTSHQCGLAGSNPGINAICGLSLFLALSFALRCFLEILPHVREGGGNMYSLRSSAQYFFCATSDVASISFTLKLKWITQVTRIIIQKGIITTQDLIYSEESSFHVHSVSQTGRKLL